MKRKLLQILTVSFLVACNTKTEEKSNTEPLINDTISNIVDETSKEISPIEEKKEPSDFVPDGFVISEKIQGDLNKDGIHDVVLVIKNGKRNGLIVLIDNKNKYQAVIKNYDCFTTDSDGGVYMEPELMVSIKKGNLIVDYSRGRYGTEKYTFRLKDSDFELIGFDKSENTGPIVNNETSINFLTKKKQYKENTNENADGEDEVFKETWTNISIKKLIKLSEIKRFENLEMYNF